MMWCHLRPLPLGLLGALMLLTAGCAATAPGAAAAPAPGSAAAPAEGAWWLTNVRLPAGLRGGQTPPQRNPGARVALRVEAGRITALSSEGAPEGAVHVDGGGAFIAPMVTDSHTHLAFSNAGRGLVLAGVGAALDLAAPLGDLRAVDDLETLHAGPMLAAPGGYPTQSWGSGGYGAECATVDDVERAIAAAHAAGARVVKLSLGHPPELSVDLLERAVSIAHEGAMKVVVHALSDDAAQRAADLGADALAHAPLEPLSEETVALWADRAVISTLAAFGRSPAAVDNLRRLHAAGATILYGTDLGNSQTMGIQSDEVRALLYAGLSSEEVVTSMTSAPRAFWGLEGGAMEIGAPAKLLLLQADPTRDATILARPRQLVVGGALVDAALPR